MTRRPEGPPLPSSKDSVQVTYLEARDRFLSRFPKEDNDSLIRHYADIGRYVLDRWQAEDRDRVDGQPLDESATDCRWDECTEKHLRDLSTEVGVAYEKLIRKGRARAFAADVVSTTQPVSGCMKAAGWVVVEAFRGFVGALGILLFGMALIWLMPSVVKAVRSQLDDALPPETSTTHNVAAEESRLPAPAIWDQSKNSVDDRKRPLGRE